MSFSRRPEPPLEILEGLRHPVPMEDRPDADARRTVTILATARAMRREKRRGELRARMFALGAAAAVLLGLAGAGWQLARPVEPALPVARSTVSSLKGNELRVSKGAVVATLGGVPTAVPAGGVARVGEGDEIRSAADGEATLMLPRGVRVDIGGATKAGLAAISELEQRVRLDLGTTSVSVPNPGGPRLFTIRTPDAEVIVHGTEFSVLVEPDRTGSSTVTSVRVTRGAVLVLSRGEERLIDAGSGWSSRVEPSAPKSEAPAAPLAEESIERRPRNARRNAPASPAPGALTGQNRLFQASLNARKAGDDARAIAYLDELLTRFPDSPLAEEARLARFRAVQRLGRAPDGPGGRP